MAQVKKTAGSIEGEHRLMTLSLISYFSLDVANIMILMSNAENTEGSSPVDRPEGASPQGSEEDLSDVEANVDDLIALEKRKTLEFGLSQVTQSLIDFYVRKGYFAMGICRPPGAEVTLAPKDGEVVVFKETFVAGMRFPLDHILPSLFLPFNAKLHHLTPNAIVQLSKFLWAVGTSGVQLSTDVFCHLYELHSQTWKVFTEGGDDESYEAQSGCCTFVPRKNNKKIGLKRLELSHSQKNKWEDDLAQYWFYAKICFPNPKKPGEVFYLMAVKVLPFEHTHQPGFNKRLPEFKSFVSAFETASRVCGG